MNGIRNKLPQLLFDKDVSILEFSKQVDIPYATLHGIVNNSKESVRFDHLSKICKGLGVDVGDIYEVAEEN